jgi:Tol biopolymer transport system component
LTVACAAMPLVLAGAALAGTPAAPRTERVSVSSSGAQGDRGSEGGATLSTGGRFAAFSSLSHNLVPGDTNNKQDVFVRDRWTHNTERVSLSSSGKQGNDESYGASVSGNGRYVVFLSMATNLVSGSDRNGHDPDAFVRDRKLHRTFRVSVSTTGKQGSVSSRAAISADGRSVAFVSSSQLAPQDTRNQRRDVYVRNLRTNRTELVSASLGGKSGDWYSVEPSVSGDGRFVAFTSRATNLVAATKFKVADVYVRDMKAHKTRLVSVNSSGDPATRRSFLPSISSDGRFVAFTSIAALVGDDTNGLDDVYLRDVQSGTTQRVSVSTSGAQSTRDHSEFGVVSEHGEFVAFQSGLSDELVPGDANGPLIDILVRDVARHTTTRVDVNDAGLQANDNSSGPSISHDGRFVGFWSQATNLATPDTNHKGDAFVRGPLRP